MKWGMHHGDEGVIASNLSLDKIVPGSQGGVYEEAKVHGVCVGCQMVKGSYDANVAAATILALKASSFAMLNGLSKPTQTRAPTATLSQRDERFMRWWAMREWQSPKSSIKICKKKEGNLSQQDIYQMFRELYVGQGLHIDPSGVELPVVMASIDRPDPTLGYSKTNVRILLNGFLPTVVEVAYHNESIGQLLREY